MEKYNKYEWELAEEKSVTRRIIAERTKEKFKERMAIMTEGKSKTIYFLNGKEEWEPEKNSRIYG